jgi:hypothetical protein
MELLFSRPSVRGTINGEGPMPMLIDPQLETSILSPSLVDRLKLKVARNSANIASAVVQVEFGPLKAAQVPVEIRDTTRYLGDSSRTPPALVLSLSVWTGQLVTLDYRRFQVRVEPGALPEPNGHDLYALVTDSNELRVNLGIDGRTVEGRLDLMFPGTLVLPNSFATELPLVTKPTETIPVTLREGVVKVREARLAGRVTLAAAEGMSPLVLLGDVPRPTVGYAAFIRLFDRAGLSITYDFTRKRARLNRQ